MPTYHNSTAARITWGGSWIEAGETKVCTTHWPYTELGLTLVSALPVVATPIRHSQRVSLAAPSATAASAVLTVDTGKTLTFTAGTIDHPMFTAGNAALAVQGEGLAVQIEANSADTLAVSNPTGTNVILVQLASTTANKNTAALIEDGVQALGTVDGIDVSDMTVVGNTAYNNAPVAGRSLGTPATVVLDFGDSKTLTISSVYCGSWYNALSVAVEQADDDDLAMGYADGLITIQLAADTASKNSASAIQTLLRAQTIEGLDVSAATVTESAEYAAARPKGTKSVRAHEVYSDNEMTTSLGKLTITAGHGGATGENATNFSLGIAQDDALDVSYTAGTGGLPGLVTILLANATPGNNSAANIQTALRAETGTDLGEYLSLATVTADATWAASPPIAYNASQLVTADSVTGVDAASIAETALTGGDEEIVAETDLDNAVDGTTITTVALPSYGKGSLSLVPITGEVTAQLGDSDEEILLSTSVEYQGTHRYGKVPAVTLTSIAAAEVLVLVEEAE
jgi:hypothetical protein